MRRGRQAVSVALAIALLAGCPGAPTGPREPRPAATSRPPTAGPTSPGAPAGPTARPGRPPGDGPAADARARLAGVVRVPVRLISDKGLGVVSNNGSNVVSNNGGGLVGKTKLRLAAAPAQLPFAGVRVRLADAAGRPLRGADGAALEAETDAAGRFSLPAPPAGHNHLLEVSLGPDAGWLRAIAPPAAESVDLDLVSTLTTGYILGKYVAGQADPVATLDRLPAAVEAETRAKAAASLDATAAPPPSDLTDAAVVATVDALRGRDAALDGQLEVVRKLLIAAGQADLGAGRPALEVALSPITALAVAPDGTLYMACPGDRRVWRLGPDGTLATAAGAGKAAAGPVAGLAGPVAGLLPVSRLAIDGRGRPLLLEDPHDLTFAGGEANGGRITRLEADGRLTELAAGQPNVDAVFAGEGDEALALAVADPLRGAELLALGAGGARRVVATLAGSGRFDLGTEALGRDAQGRLYGGATREGVRRIRRLEPATGALETLAERPLAAGGGLGLDAAGHVFEADAAGRLTVRRPDGAVVPLMEGLPAALTPAFDRGAALAADGTAYLAEAGPAPRVHRVRGGRVEAVAGRAAAAPAGRPGPIALGRPAGLVATADGLLVADAQAHQVLRVRPDGAREVVAGTGAAGMAGDGGPVAAAVLQAPGALRADAAGRLFVLDQNQAPPVEPSFAMGFLEVPKATWTPNVVRRIGLGPGGAIATVPTPPGAWITDFAPGPDGGLFVATLADGQAALARVAADGAATPLVAPPPADAYAAIGAIAYDAAAGVLWATATTRPTDMAAPAPRHRLLRWTAAGGLTTAAEGEAFRVPATGAGALALDPAGRPWFADMATNRIHAFDPASKQVRLVFGPGAARLAGSGIDDSLERPRYLAFGPTGDLYVADVEHRQVKLIPADQLR